MQIEQHLYASCQTKFSLVFYYLTKKKKTLYFWYDFKHIRGGGTNEIRANWSYSFY